MRNVTSTSASLPASLPREIVHDRPYPYRGFNEHNTTADRASFVNVDSCSILDTAPVLHTGNKSLTDKQLQRPFVNLLHILTLFFVLLFAVIVR